MLVDLQQSGVFLEELFLVSQDVVSLDAEAKIEAFFHILFPELFADFPEVLIRPFVVVMLQVNGHSFLVFADVDVKPSKFDSALDFVFDLIDNINHYVNSLFVGWIDDFNAFSDLLCVH